MLTLAGSGLKLRIT